MENMLNKLRSTVNSAASNAVSNAFSIASQVSNYLPGNPVTREFEAKSHIASAGTGLSWKVYSGYKKSSKQDVSLFVFEKRLLDRWDRQDRELMLEILRRGVAQLTRIRHPQILTIQHPLEESRDSLAFATEPVLASLANVLGSGAYNMPSPIPDGLQGFKLHDVEIKYGFVQVCEALQFLHQSVKVVHCCLSPENIIVNQQGAWKLFGFDFCLANAAPPDAMKVLIPPQPSWQFPEYRPSLPPSCLPPLEYLAPECITGCHTVGPRADMFSLGALITAVFNGGRSYTAHKGDLEGYKRLWKELSHLSSHQLLGVPAELREETCRLLQPQPKGRPLAQQLAQIDYFNDIGVKTLSYLDQMFQWDNMQKSQFYKGLPQLIPQLPHRVSLLRIVPAVVQESVNPTMVPFVLPVVLQVAERATDEEFVEHVLPHLRPIMLITEPIQIMVQLLQKSSLLLSKTPPSSVRSDVLPLLYRALSTDTPALQEMCLSALPSCAPHLDASTLKTQLLPRVQKLCLGTQTLSVRVCCLVCVGRLLPHLDKWLVLDSVVPFLVQLPSREAPVIMAAVGILQVSLQSQSLGLTKEIMATKVLPFLLPLSIENCLSPQQHRTLLALVRAMLDKVEAEHRTKLEYLSSIKDEQKTLHQLMPDSAGNSNASCSNGVASGTGNNTELDSVFAGLGLGQYVSPSHSARRTDGGTKQAPGVMASAGGCGGGGVLSPAASTTAHSSASTVTTNNSAKSSPCTPRDLTASLTVTPLPPPPQPSSFTATVSNSSRNNINSVTNLGGGTTFGSNISSTQSNFSNSSINFNNLTSPTNNNRTTASNNTFVANFSSFPQSVNSNAGGNKPITKTALDDLLPTPPKAKPLNQMQVPAQQTWAISPGFGSNTAPFVQGFPTSVGVMGNGAVYGTTSNNSNNVNSMNNIGINAANNMNMNGMNSMMNMNSMGSNMMPCLRTNNMPNSLSSGSIKPLSSSDIKDFLS